MHPTDVFRAARDHLIELRTDYEKAYATFEWPRPERFNWALDWFDVIAKGNERPALWIVGPDGEDRRLTFAELSERSSRVASWLKRLGATRGDRILVMLSNVVPLWEVMLASMKLGCVVIPATTQLTESDLADRITRGDVRLVVTDASGPAKLASAGGALTRVVVGAPPPKGWYAFDDAYAEPASFEPDGRTDAGDAMLLYFTSGTTAKPKLVLHTHASYPIGHLSTMYWIGLREGDVHLNISSPGWAKHAWSSFFAPWNAGATVLVHAYERFDAKRTLEVIASRGVTSLCAPPTVWRLLVREDLASHEVKLREVVGAGEPMNPEIISRVEKAWDLVLRDGYGQTETTAQIGNTPGQPLRPGSMGRPLPGYRAELLGPGGRPGADEGEIALALDPRPVGLMTGYMDDPEHTAEVTQGGWYRTGDVAARDADGYYWYVGRADDVFKSSDYRLSPFELESVLIEHPAVVEAAVVPSPDPVRLSVPKAYVTLAREATAGPALAKEILDFVRERVAPYKRIRRIQFGELPKTISGKIRRVELRRAEARHGDDPSRAPLEYWEEDL